MSFYVISPCAGRRPPIWSECSWSLGLFPITIIRDIKLVGNLRIAFSCLAVVSIFVSLLNLFLVAPRRIIALLTLIFGMEGAALKILFWNLVMFVVVDTIFAVADFSLDSVVVLCCGSCGRYHLFDAFTIKYVCSMFYENIIKQLSLRGGGALSAEI